MKKTRYYCDLCKEEGSNHPKQIQVIFTTEQQQGKNCEPYLSTEKIDICGVESIATGGGHTLFLKKNGEVFVCGRNNSGQLGTGNNNNLNVPTKNNLNLWTRRFGYYYKDTSSS